ncbi:transglycosylase SLT domain-containing protein [Acinetobacter baumannii]|uniref:lytic transglycosylase domain-containing protein n=6 Tax=Acinetobacter baumannii TaxID=470 RepID=UPI000B171903|nr:lytic transglycosylase domain-containing protein [Acinetobacter baumannii]MCP9159604.1 transglycosylase SLT domain-containing protein [Acinetobacter baumannii]
MSNNRVEVHVGAKTSELKKGMNEAESIVKDTAQEIEVTGKKVDFQIDVSGVQKTFDNLSSNISTQMLGLGKKIAAGIGSALAVDGLVSFTRNAISTASEVQKMSDMLGESVEDFQYFAKGAQTAGLSLEQFGMMGKDALDRLGEARRGEGEMMDFFEKVAPKIGVTIDMFKDLSGPEVIQAYYDGLEKANLSHAETITYMEQIVNDGSLLIPLLKDGGVGFKKWGEEAKNAGAIMSKDMVNNLGKAKENLYTLELQFQGFQAMLINSVTPAVTAIAQNFDNIKAVVIALGAAISAKLVVQCAVLTKEFVIGVAQGMAYQMQLSALQGQAMRTATAMGVLRSASALLGGPAGLGMLALQGVAAGAAFLYMKRSSDEAVPALSTQGKTVAQLREEYEKLDKAQQRVLMRQATADLAKAEQGFRKQEIALLGLVRALISHSDASEADKKTAKDLYDQYLQGKLNADQLATGINNLRTVEAKHKTGIDEKAAAVNKERKAVIDAQGVLKTYNDVVKQGTKDNKSHTDSINDKANALANLTAKQMEYVRESNKQSERERYIQHNMKVGGVSRERAEHMADARDKAGMGYSAKDGAMPEAVKQAEEADWKRKQAAEAREEAEKKAEETQKRQTKELEKQQQILQVNARVKANAEKFNYSGFEAKYGLPSGMLSALNMQETKGRNVEGVQTKYGTAKGNFQMLDMTAKRFGVSDPFDTKQAAEGAAKYMRFLLDKYGDINKAISAYHAGEGNVDRGTGIGPVNRQYVKNVKGYMAGVNGVKVGTDASAYEKTLQEQVSKADEAEKQKLALQYKYADARKQIAIDLDNDIKEIEKSTLSGDEQINAIVMANQQASDKLKAIDIENLEHRLSLNELEISGREILADRIYEIEMAQLQALFDAGKISNVDKVNLEKELQDKLTAVKRIGLEERLDLEMQLGALTGDPKGIATASNNLGALDHQKSLSDINQPKKLDDAQLADFEEKFGGLTSRMSSLWDKGIQAMLNGTLTWKGAMNAIFSELAAEFVQNMITAPMKKYAASLATRLAVKLGFIKTETAAEASGQAAQTGATIAGEATRTSVTAAGGLARLGLKAAEAIKGIMMSAWEAMAGAFKAMVAIPYVGPILAVGAGAAAFGLVAGLAGKIKSARGGYDIPSGVNPVTQLHEDEMVLPSQHANTIREMGKALRNGASFGAAAVAEGGGAGATINISAIDAKSIQRLLKSNGRAVASGLQSYARGFGKNGK